MRIDEFQLHFVAIAIRLGSVLLVLRISKTFAACSPGVGCRGRRVMRSRPLELHDSELLASAVPFVFTPRPFGYSQLEDSEARGEDYGQVPIYRGDLEFSSGAVEASVAGSARC